MSEKFKNCAAQGSKFISLQSHTCPHTEPRCRSPHVFVNIVPLCCGFTLIRSERRVDLVIGAIPWWGLVALPGGHSVVFCGQSVRLGPHRLLFLIQTHIEFMLRLYLLVGLLPRPSPVALFLQTISSATFGGSCQRYPNLFLPHHRPQSGIGLHHSSPWSWRWGWGGIKGDTWQKHHVCMLF